MERCPTQAVLPLVGLAAEKVIRDRYISGGGIFPGGTLPDASRPPVGRTRGGESHPRPVYFRRWDFSGWNVAQRKPSSRWSDSRRRKSSATRVFAHFGGGGVFGGSPNTLRNWENAGKIVAHRHPVNPYRLFKQDDLDILLRQVNQPAREK
ncbi:MAG: hypothetical protein R6U98_34435 [Pirellulaceae bacterium]